MTSTEEYIAPAEQSGKGEAAEQGATIPDSFSVDPALLAEIGQFYFYEAQLLDDRRYLDWLTLLAQDVRYWMPTRSNRQLREMDREHSTRKELAHFDDTFETLSWRVGQVDTGMHWAEDPPSRTRHLISNIRAQASKDRPDEYRVESSFLCYRNRLEDEVDIWVGQRSDTLRHTGTRRWAIAARTIVLDQNVILSKNLSIFF